MVKFWLILIIILMGACAGIKFCETCNLSIYNQTYDINVISVIEDNYSKVLENSIELRVGKGERKSWRNFQNMLDSDRSWEIADPRNQ